MREIIITIMISGNTTTSSNCVLGDGVPIGIEGVGDINISLVVNVGSEEDVDKDTNDKTLVVVTVELNTGSEEDADKDINGRTLVVDELDNIKLMEVVVNNDNMLLVLEMISYEMRRLVVSDVKG